jgi:IS1 family transposase/transposase-like protein
MKNEISNCRRCGSINVVKAGKIKGNQRYKCKNCGFQFQPNRAKGRSQSTKRLAVLLYLSGLSIRTISKIVKTDLHAVYRWIRKFAEDNYEKPEPISNAVVIELDEMWHYLHSKKNKHWIWKAFCRDTRQLIDWQCGRRDSATFSKLYEHLKKWNVSVFFADDWSVYSSIIPSELLIQTKSETHLIESNNMPQRHWFARFRRETVCISRSEDMVDLTVGLYANFHVNHEISYDYFLDDIII